MEPKEYYTTKQIAKICHLSVRTIQYYDKKSLVKPSHQNAGGRRLYQLKDIEKFKLIQLYKTLGFTLKEIKEQLSTGDSKKLILAIEEQTQALDLLLKQQLDTLEKLHLIKDKLIKNGTLNLSSLEQLEKWQEEKHLGELQRQGVVRLVLLMTLLLGGSIILHSFLPQAMFVLYIGIIPLLYKLIKWHVDSYFYICPTCQHSFVIDMKQDLFSFNDNSKGNISNVLIVKKGVG